MAKGFFIFLNLIFLLSRWGLAFAQGDLERIVVKRSGNDFSTSWDGDSPVSGLSRVSSLDMRQRASFGIQGDMSLRGSTYEQVGVAIDGLRVNDPQTGHHNLDIPLTSFDIEHIEVLKDGSSSIYGSGALAGSVNFVVKKPPKNLLSLETLFGEHALYGQAVSLSRKQQGLSGRISLDHKISKAARPNTDFEYSTATAYLLKEWESQSLDALFGYQRKDFGAANFYSNLYPEEEEHTRTTFVKSGLTSQVNTATLKNNLFWRKHEDKFILRRNNPTSVNYHTTHVYGWDSGFTLPTMFGDLLLGGDIGGEQIVSSNLGKHARMNQGFKIALEKEITERLSASGKFGLQHYQKWGWQEPFNLGMGYKIIGDVLKARTTFARSFRLPSFTDLYYSDPGNKGNPNLTEEKADNYILGFDYKRGKIDLSLEGFLRQASQLIDWTRTSTADPWQVTNLGDTAFKGLDFSSKFLPEFAFYGINFKELTFSYAYTFADRKASGYFSKYALDILKHQYIVGLQQEAYGLNFSWQLSYNQRYYGETYFIGDFYLSKRFQRRNYSFEPFLKIDNFSNAEYSQIGGVIQPGRWIQGGVKLEW